MNFEFINKITAGKSPEFSRPLFYGYLRSLTDKEIVDLIKRYALDKQYSTFLLPRLKELEGNELLDSLAKHLLLSYVKSTAYKEKRRFSYYLNCIVDKCSFIMQKEILTFFLNSGKRYLRKYAYKINLNTYDLFQNALKLITENPDEATFLMKTIAFYYEEKFILFHFEKLIMQPGIEEYQIRKLFIRHPSLKEKQWLWLKHNYPHSFLYLAAKKNYQINDEDCMEIYKHRSQPANFNSILDNGLLLWCLAKLNKWAVLEKIAAEDELWISIRIEKKQEITAQR
jgi:hypothetical protein